MRWRLSDRFDPVAVAIADRHYSRRKRGKPGTPQFVKPGACLVLLTPDSSSELGVLWVTSVPRFTRHAWPGTWECSLFRNEIRERYLSSELVTEAVAATCAKYGAPPPGGFLTFIDADEVRRKRDPGRCFRKAGFEPAWYTKVFRRLVLVLPVERFPAPVAAAGTQERIPA